MAENLYGKLIFSGKLVHFPGKRDTDKGGDTWDTLISKPDLNDVILLVTKVNGSIQEEISYIGRRLGWATSSVGRLPMVLLL